MSDFVTVISIPQICLVIASTNINNLLSSSGALVNKNDSGNSYYCLHLVLYHRLLFWCLECW